MTMNKTEAQTTKKISGQFEKIDRVFYKIMKGKRGKNNGIPDSICTDKNGTIVGLELKSDKGYAYPNQVRQGIKIIQSGGRYIVGYYDFTIDAMDNEEFPKYVYTDEEMRPPKGKTYEIILEERDDT